MLQITSEIIRIGSLVTSPEPFYLVRPLAPTLPVGATVIVHKPGIVTYQSDGETQREYDGDIGALTALIEEESAITADIAAL